jgi:hypothetical protein
MTDQKRREFWIAGFKFGDNEACSQYCTVDLIERKNRDIIHVREVLPGDLVLSADEADKVYQALKDEEKRCGRLFGGLAEALAIIEKMRMP